MAQQRRRGGLLQMSGAEGLDAAAAAAAGSSDSSGREPPAPASQRGGTAGWAKARRAMLTSHAHALNAKSQRRFRLPPRRGSGSNGQIEIGGGIPVSIPEEDAETDLHLAFRTQSSLSVIKEYFYELVQERGRDQVCSEAEVSSGRLLLHCISVNAGLILNSDGSLASSASLVEDFIMNELLPSYPSAIIEEDDMGHLPFIEVVVNWAKHRKAARERASNARNSTLGLADIVSQAAKAFFSKTTISNLDDQDSSAAPSYDGGGAAALAAKRAKDLYDLPPMVEWCLGMLSTILTSRRRSSPLSSRVVYGHGSTTDFGESNTSLDFHGDPYSQVDHRHQQQEENPETQFDSLFVINEKGVIEMVNDAAVAEFGWTKTEFIGANISMICGEDHGPKHDKYLQNYLKTGVKKVMGKHDRKLFAKRKDGSEFRISLGITETQMGNERRFCGFVKHVKEKRESRKETTRSSCVGPHFGYNDCQDSSSSLGQQSSSNRPDAAFGAVYNEIVVDSLASIPGLLKELLLVDDEATRERVFSLPIVQQALLWADFFGDGAWLMDLLNREDTDKVRRISSTDNAASSRRGSVFFKRSTTTKDTMESSCDYSEAAVFFLEKVSNLRNEGKNTIVVGNSLEVSSEEKRKALLDRIGNVDGLIRSLCNLEEDLLKRAAVTSVIQRVLDKKIFSPFALTAAAFDLTFHLLFICSFRLGPAEAMFHLSANDITFRPQQYLISTIVLIGCITYFVRKLANLVVAKRTSIKRSDSSLQRLSSPWRLLEMTTYMLSIYSMISIDHLLRRNAVNAVAESEIPFHIRSFVALTTPLLWFRLLAHIKMFNKQLATFILCSVEILRDIKWFMLVLLIIIASFAQMLVSMTFDPDEYQTGTTDYRYFSMDEYIKAYTIMLGDIDSEALQKHSGIVILFVLYTFGVCVVLLNILIAIVSESYAHSVYSSTLMLGKARVMFVAEIMDSKQQYRFHGPLLSNLSGLKIERARAAKNYIDIVCIVFAAIFTKSIDNTIAAKRLCLQKASLQSFFGLTSLDFEACIIFIILTALVIGHRYAMIYSLRSEEGIQSFGSQQSTKFKLLGIIADSLHAYISRNIDSLTANEDDDDKDNDHSETVKSVDATSSDRKLQRAIASTKSEIKSEIKRSSEALRHILHESEDKTQASIAICEHHLSTSLEDIVGMQERMDLAIAASEKRIVDALSQRIESLFRNHAMTERNGEENEVMNSWSS